MQTNDVPDPFAVLDGYIKVDKKKKTDERLAKKKVSQRVLCKCCQQVTQHKTLSYSTRSEDLMDEIGEFYCWEYYTLQCLGCNSVCLLEEYYDSNDWRDDIQDFTRRKTIYPSPHKDNREQMQKAYDIPTEVRGIYLETIKAFNAGLPILTAIGLRATIEAICIDKEIVGQNLEKKIDQMVIENLITRDGAKLLHVTRDLGNFSAHRMEKHKDDVLSLCLNIVENVMLNLFILPFEAVPVIDSITEKKAKTNT
jgi:hypothetical protein